MAVAAWKKTSTTVYFPYILHSSGGKFAKIASKCFWQVLKGLRSCVSKEMNFSWTSHILGYHTPLRSLLFLPREHKIHIFEPTCNVLFIIWRLYSLFPGSLFSCSLVRPRGGREERPWERGCKSKRRESWRHWTIRHSQRWHTENTPLGSRMKWRMESTSGLVPSKTLSSIW